MSQEVIKHTIRKSEMSAQTSFELGRLAFPRNEFLNCSYVEQKEEVEFIYEVKGYKEFSQIRQERRDTRLILLMDCAKLVASCESYKYALSPENLYYDIHNEVAVMDRDLYGRGEEWSFEEFLTRYLALIGFALQKRYSYEDYINGGMDLLEKDKFLAQIAKETSIEGILTHLQQELEAVIEDYTTNKEMVDKKAYRRNRRLLGGLGGVLFIAAVFIAYIMLWVRPYQNAVIDANKQYLRINYKGVVEAFSGIGVGRLSVYDKYILASAFIQCENLTPEQKKNISNALSLDSNEKVLEYWVYLGRLDVEMAEDIAQQVSDQDLLLYAYLKDKSMTEEDTKISGEEKAAKIESLTSKIEKLSEAYDDAKEKGQQEQETPAPSPK